VTRKALDALSTAAFPSLEVVERRRADDGFVKYLFESPLGGRVEAVRIPLFDEKYVVCISSQVGCALACDFCMTGKLGFQRNLQTWEMLDQVRWIRAEADRPVRGVVFMGMGEPLLNYTEALRAAGTLCHPAGYAISGKAITLSTVGVVPAIHRYVREDPPYRLAFSITSAIPEKRAQVLPVERTYPLPDLVEAIRAYSTRRRERAMLAYVMIRGFNTGREDAEALARAFDGIPIKVDLIDVTDPSGRYLPPTAEELSRFRDHLQVTGAPIARRYSGGKDIGAACGTLEASQRGGQLLSAPASC
jgi:23S rRNA (adenine2503-C2)-methyltransferase